MEKKKIYEIHKETVTEQGAIITRKIDTLDDFSLAKERFDRYVSTVEQDQTTYYKLFKYAKEDDVLTLDGFISTCRIYDLQNVDKFYKIIAYYVQDNQKVAYKVITIYSDVLDAAQDFKSYETKINNDGSLIVYELVCYFSDEEFCKVLAVTE